MTNHMTTAEKYAQLTKIKRQLESELINVKDELRSLEDKLLTAIEAGEFPARATVNGSTIHLRTERWPKLRDGIDRQDAVKALQNAGYDHCITYNHQTVRGLINEAVKNGEPWELNDWIEIDERVKLGVR